MHVRDAKPLIEDFIKNKTKKQETAISNNTSVLESKHVWWGQRFCFKTYHVKGLTIIMIG